MIHLANILWYVTLALIPLSERLTVGTKNVTKGYNDAGELKGKFGLFCTSDFWFWPCVTLEEQPSDGIPLIRYDCASHSGYTRPPPLPKGHRRLPLYFCVCCVNRKAFLALVWMVSLTERPAWMHLLPADICSRDCSLSGKFLFSPLP